MSKKDKSNEQELTLSRRSFLKTGAFAGAAGTIPWMGFLNKSQAATLMAGLSDPAMQPKFQVLAPNALAKGFKLKAKKRKFKVEARVAYQQTGHVGTDGVTPTTTSVWGYGKNKKNASWPGKTFEVKSGKPVKVTWKNKLGNSHLLPVDTSGHWCYSLPGYQQFSIESNGVPIVPHLHGGHTESPSDGNPEFFFSPNWKIRGPRWEKKTYDYDNSQAAANLWYHDHALGLTRLNVYAGLAGFYIIRDKIDTGKHKNPLGLPAKRYELAYAIQDRMFWNNGELFYPAFPGDPAWDDFITNEGVTNPPIPSALAEFFGDHMVVNGKLWPKANVEPRNYRMRLLNGSDSRFIAIRFRPTNAGATDLSNAGAPLPFYVIGGDQGLAQEAVQTDFLLISPGERYDIVVDFSQVAQGSRIIMENIGGDAPFGGALVGDPGFDPADLYPDRQTDRIMAFDVTLRKRKKIKDRFNPAAIAHYAGNTNPVTNVRKLALFEGRDEFGRLQPMLGTAEPVMDMHGNIVNGALPWHAPITENPALNSTEIWEIYNATEDAHPIHVHQVNFEVLDRQAYTASVIQQSVLHHNGTTGIGFRLENIALSGNAAPATDVEKAPMDMVTTLPGEVTRIKMTFDRPGRYVWHCHILSHEDHDMMRPLHIGPMGGGNGGD